MKLLIFLGIGMQICSYLAFYAAWKVSALPAPGYITPAAEMSPPRCFAAGNVEVGCATGTEKARR